MAAFLWMLAVAFVAPPPPTPPPDTPPVFRTAAPVVATPSPTPTASPAATPRATESTPFVWRFGTPVPIRTTPPAAKPHPAARRTVRLDRSRPTARPAVGSHDARAAARDHNPVRYLIGPTWSCTTIAGTPEEHRYVRTAAGFDLHNIFQLKASSVQLDEHYRFNPHAKLWMVTLANGVYVAFAGSWTGNLWTFNGTTQAGNKRLPVRMIYQYFDEFVFRRDFQLRRGNDWLTYAAETCTRPPHAI